MSHIKNEIKSSTARLFAALDMVEQAAQAVRWRVANAPEDLSVLADEVAALCGESAHVATFYGQFAALKGLEILDDSVAAKRSGHSVVEDWPDGGASGDANDSSQGFADVMAKRRRAAVERFREVAEAIAKEASVNRIVYQDRGLCGRAFVRRNGERLAIIHVPQPTTRRRLYVFAHECGHVALDHDGSKPVHRKEYEAEKWAIAALRAHGVPVPLKQIRYGKKYVASKIEKAVRRRTRQFDRESYHYCKEFLSSDARQWVEDGRKLADLGGRKASVQKMDEAARSEPEGKHDVPATKLVRGLAA